jgi:hypothetical protein
VELIYQDDFSFCHSLSPQSKSVATAQKSIIADSASSDVRQLKQQCRTTPRTGLYAIKQSERRRTRNCIIDRAPFQVAPGRHRTIQLHFYELGIYVEPIIFV